MAEAICRALRDGSLEGEHAAALTIKDSVQSSFGSHAFCHFLQSLASNISAGRSQARALVLVALNKSPSFYFDFLRGLNVSSSERWFQILDCYSDPLGWKERLRPLAAAAEGSLLNDSVTVVKDVRDADKFLSRILDLGRGAVGEGKARFAVAIDSVSEMLRYASLPSVTGLINNLRSHDQVSSVFWLIHTDIHEIRAPAALEYISTMVASLEPWVQPSDGQRGSENLILLEQNALGGKFHVRLKRRNGRVKILDEEFYMEQSGIKFTAVSSDNTRANQNLLPKIQFNLQLSEKEREDKAKVVLPFEHQGNGENIPIYDGRRSLSESEKDSHLIRPVATSVILNTETDFGKGEIHYVRDSDDELPDSDEDPDDDLDI